METSISRNQTAHPLEGHLGYWLRRVSNAVSGEFARALQARQTSVAEWVFLRLLYDRKQATPGQLARELEMTRGAITKIIDKLQAKGWLNSRIDPTDNRVQLLALTGAGRRIVPSLARIADRNDKQFFDALTPAERQTLRHLLQTIAERHSLTGVPIA
jgi:DNA-binding MarR family transcriptional regulator